jgi:hypothetical protein
MTKGSTIIIVKEQIEQVLQVLVGMPLWCAGRAGDLEWFHFGGRHAVVDQRYGLKVVGDYALHVQCSWRIVGTAGIIVASQDRYYPAGDPDQVSEDFEWDQSGANRCDERISLFFAERKQNPLVVESVQADHIGSFSLTLSDGYVFEVFPDDSLEGEHWRLFQPAMEGGDFVLTGQGIET